jgi:hypothetical protein
LQAGEGNGAVELGKRAVNEPPSHRSGDYYKN